MVFQPAAFHPAKVAYQMISEFEYRHEEHFSAKSKPTKKLQECKNINLTVFMLQDQPNRQTKQKISITVC